MKIEIRDSLTNKRFTIATLFMFLCLCGYSIESWIESTGWGREYQPSALQQSVGGIFFGGFMLLLPFCATFSCVLLQVDEIRSHIYYYRAIRTNIRTYIVIKAVSSMVISALTVMCAFLVHAALWNMIALPCDPYTYPYHEIGFFGLYGDWYKTAYGLPMYIEIAFGMGFCASTWSIVGLATAVWIPDPLIVITVPTIINYFLSYDVFYYFFGWILPHPADLYNDGLTADRLFQAVLLNCAIIFIAFIVYYKGMKRRLQHA